ATLAASRPHVSGFHRIGSHEQLRPRGCFLRRFARMTEKNQPHSYRDHLHLRGPVLVVTRVAPLHNAEISSGGATFNPDQTVSRDAVIQKAFDVEIGIVAVDIARRADESG